MITTHTTYTYKGYSLPFNTESDPVFEKIDEDGRAVLAFLVRDEDAADPFEEFDEGEFYQFDRSRVHYMSRPSVDDFKRIVRENPGRVVTVYTTGEGYRVDDGPFTVRDTRGRGERDITAIEDVAGYYIVPEDAADPAAYAKAQIEQYSAWCTGDVYGVIVWVYESPDAEPDREREVWGFYGREYAREELRGEFEQATGEEWPCKYHSAQ